MADKNPGGRPRIRHRPDVRLTIRLHPGDDDPILERLRRLPKGRWSGYIRNVLAGAPVEALDEALSRETELTAATLDRLGTMWGEEEQ